MSGKRLKPQSANKKTAPSTREPLLAAKKDLLFMTLIRSTQLLDKAVARIDTKRDLDGPNNLRYAILWETLKDYYETGSKLPTHDVLLAELEQRVALADMLTVDDAEQLSLLVAAAFAKREERVQKELPDCEKYLQDLLAEGLQSQVIAQINDQSKVLMNLPEFFHEMEERAQQISSVRVGAIRDLFSAQQAEAPPRPKVPTGCTFIDDYLDGGIRPGEIVGMLMPYGGGKTLTAMQIASNRVAQLRKDWVSDPNPNKKLPLVYVFFYEEIEEDAFIRAMSYSARIERKILEEKRYDDFSTRELRNYKPYEHRMWPGKLDQPDCKIPGERERFEAKRLMLSRGLRVVCFNGSNENYSVQAADLMRGIRSVIDEDQRENDNPGVSLILIDYAGAAVDRHIEYHHKDESYQRNLIGRLPLRAKTQLALHYDCGVIMYHQLNTTANSRAPGVAAKITDAAEARNFPENCDFCLMVGTKNDDGLAVISNVKQRRTGKKPDRVVKIDGLMCAMRDVHEQYMIENNRIVSTKDFGRIADFEDEEKERKKIKDRFGSDDMPRYDEVL